MTVKPFDPTAAQININNSFAESGNPKRQCPFQPPKLPDNNSHRITLLPEQAQVRVDKALLPAAPYKNMHNKSDNSGTRPPVQATRLLDQLPERLQDLHYSLRIEQAYVDRAKALAARLLYRTGLHPRESLSLHIKDLDFTRSLIIVRDGKGAKDRVVAMPLAPMSDFRAQ
jgi:integrase